MIKFLKTFSTIMALGVCTLISANSFANERPQVLWNGQVVHAGENSQAYDETVGSSIGKMIGDKLKNMQKQGILPFDISPVDNYQNNDIESKIAAEGKTWVGLVPVVLSDAVKCDTFDYNGKIWYKYDVRTLISLMFCVKEGDGIHIAYTIPLYSYGMLGDDLGHNLNSGNPELLNQVQNGNLLKEQFIVNIEGALEELNISSSMAKFLTDKKIRKNTTQVTKVDVISKISNQFSEDEVKEIVAKVFSSSYLAKHPNTVLLPDALTGNNWKSKVAKMIDPNASESSIKEEVDNPTKIVLSVYKYDWTTKEQAWDTLWNIIVGISYSDGKKEVIGKPSVRQYRVPKDIGSNGIKAMLNVEDIFAGAAMQAAQK